CFAAGPLPGEVAEVEIARDKPGFIEANVVRITVASPRRQAAAEDDFLECSPWQGVDYEFQTELKRAMLADAFGHPKLSLPVTDMIVGDGRLGYRNKLEFSLKKGENSSLAFHTRGSYEDLVALPHGCKLGSEAMNKAAGLVLSRIDALKLAGYVETLTIRQSISSGALLGVVALHQVPKRDWSDLSVPGLSGLVVTRVRHRDEHEMIWHTGEAELVEKVGGLELAYPFDGFFQTNPPMFERALARILAAVPKDCNVVDLYGGVGSIGLAVAAVSREVVGVEINLSSTEMAMANAD